MISDLTVIMHGLLLFRTDVILLHTQHCDLAYAIHCNTQNNEGVGEERQWTVLAYHMSGLPRLVVAVAYNYTFCCTCVRWEIII